MLRVQTTDDAFIERRPVACTVSTFAKVRRVPREGCAERDGLAVSPALTRLRRTPNYLSYFLMSARASSSNALPLAPFAPTSWIHSPSTPDAAFSQRLYSSPASEMNVLPRSCAIFFAETCGPSNTLPAQRDASRPLLSSITFLRSAGRLSYF